LNLQKKFSEFHENQIKILLIGFAMKYLGWIANKNVLEFFT
jgi:hypothetical protein